MKKQDIHQKKKCEYKFWGGAFLIRIPATYRCFFTSKDHLRQLPLKPHWRPRNFRKTTWAALRENHLVTSGDFCREDCKLDIKVTSIPIRVTT